ncbi:hypothetical protein TNCT_436321 [Trichonephila clavata]|uniref:Uncharacterized protein n=1 Tax=Trichonephila clavata TaxID=2740835 RepID=A0A8X6KBI8_TRICU|nr:hypothetical protein TNCT_436321 [Trichonephila clavata]
MKKVAATPLPSSSAPTVQQTIDSSSDSGFFPDDQEVPRTKTDDFLTAMENFDDSRPLDLGPAFRSLNASRKLSAEQYDPPSPVHQHQKYSFLLMMALP